MKSQLHQLLAGAGYSYRAAAAQVGCSSSTLSNIINHSLWPRKNPVELQRKLRAFLEAQGVTTDAIDNAFREIDVLPSPATHEESIMIRKQVTSPEARRKFGIVREIFSDQLNDPEDVFFSKETRYIRECLYQVAKHGGMLALVGESGSGKSVLRRDLIARLDAEDARVIVIEPYVLGLLKNGDKSKGVESTHICQAIVSELSPSVSTNLSPEKLFKLTHQLLRDSSRSGFRHLLIIEEAHCLPSTAIKQLKRFFELEDRQARLLSIILIGQPELKETLAENLTEVREVVQRMELVEVYPMDDLPGYVRHRCERAGVPFEQIFAPDALNALPMRLSGPVSKDGGRTVSMLYPLLVGNMLTKAINLAASLKLPKVTAETIQSA